MGSLSSPTATNQGNSRSLHASASFSIRFFHPFFPAMSPANILGGSSHFRRPPLLPNPPWHLNTPVKVTGPRPVIQLIGRDVPRSQRGLPMGNPCRSPIQWVFIGYNPQESHPRTPAKYHGKHHFLKVPGISFREGNDTNSTCFAWSEAHYCFGSGIYFQL